MLARLTPRPERGDVVAAGAVVTALFAAVLDVRFTGTWAAGVRFVVIAVLAALVGTLAVRAPLESAVPRPYQAALYVSAFVLAALTLGNLADALGADSQFGSAGAVTWTGLVLVWLCAILARGRGSAVMTLLGAATAVVVVNAFVEWAFDPDGAQTFRWVLLLCAAGLGVGATWLRDLHRRHAVALVDVCGLAIVALGLTVAQIFVFVFGFEGRIRGGGPAGWELVLAVFGFGLIAYGAVDRERVPSFIGVAILGLFVLAAGPPGKGASLVGWPIVLAVLAAVLLAVGLRPREELPPEPPTPPPSPPTAPTAAIPPTGPTAVVDP